MFSFHGLRAGVIVHGISPSEKRAAYACEIVYCTGKELVFDYLRDRVSSGGRASAAQLQARQLFGTQASPPLMRGLHFAIVDEADSILIDEARTPLILAEKAGPIEHADAMPQALEIARGLQPVDHYVIERGSRDVFLTQAGRDEIAVRASQFHGPWRSRSARDHLVAQALRALFLFQRDRQYLIDDDGQIQIIDEYTGRVLPGRNWEQGLHQMIECKEDVAMSERTQTLARITYQRFFARYLRLAGMTGTAREMASELAVTYRLDTVTLPTHRPGRRRRLPDRICRTREAKWAAVVSEAAQRQRRKQPVLIGTRSVAASEELSARLREAGVEHRVLNARQDAEEADIVAAAGQRGAVTVATNMAGRGTDIALGEGVESLGGLFVILTEYHESPRIDRQLFGRCARQGERGECVAVIALEDELFLHFGHRLGSALLRMKPATAANDAPALRLWVALVRRAAQAAAETRHARIRRDTTRHDYQLESSMGFAGDPI
jgi:preprotein translocase subunit SecA